MKKKLLFPFVAILLLPLCSTYADSNDTIRYQAVRTEITKPSALPTWSENVSSTGSVFYGDQAIELKNPTFQELRDFILKDPTSRDQFALNQYECRHFATEVNNNAEVEGLRCAFVLLCFDRGQHAVVAFDTVDRGLVYIEPQTDAAIHPEVGGKYQGREIKEILFAW
jgi:hypothetical protein